MYISGGSSSMGRSFKESLKLLEADIHHANTLLVFLFPSFSSHTLLKKKSIFLVVFFKGYAYFV